MSVLRIANLSLAASVALAIPVLPAIAQTTEQPTQLETLVIEDEGIRAAIDALSATGPVDGYVADFTATGTKIAAPLTEIPQSISIITSEQLEDRSVQNLAQALSYTAGVLSEPLGNDSRFFSPFIRGFEATDNIYINSFRFIRDFGSFSFEPYGQERIEVIKGPASVTYGQGEPGGIINLVQKRPTFTKFGEIGTEVGTDDRYVGKFDIGDVNEDGTLSYRVTALGRLADGQQDFTTDDGLYFAPTLSWAPTDDTSLTILSSLQIDTGTSPSGLPPTGTLFPHPNGQISPDTYLGEPSFNDAEGLIGTIGYEFSHRFNDTFEFRQNTQYLSSDSDYRNVYVFGDNGGGLLSSRGVNVQSETIDSFGVDNQLEMQFDTGVIEHTAVVGLDYRRNKQWRSSNFAGTVDPINAFDPVYGGPVTVDPTGENVTDILIEQTGLYVQDQIKYDDLTLSLGLRHDWLTSEEEVGGSKFEDTAVTGRAGLIYEFDNGLAPYIGYSTSFNAPSDVASATSEFLDPTEGEQYEAGIKFQPVGWDAFVTASVYELTKTGISRTIGPVTSQIGEIRSRGVELEAAASLIQGVDLIGSYTYSDAEITVGDASAPEGNRPQNIPEHSAALWLGYTFQPGTQLEGFSIGGGVRYVGERFADDANTRPLPANTVFDAAIAYEKDHYKVQLAVNNIADEEYISGCSFYGCFYGDGRSVIGSLSFKW